VNHDLLDALLDGETVEEPKRKPAKKPSKSNVQRSLEVLRKLGYTCAIVEKWNPHVKIRQDLFGFIDLLCLRKGEVLAVQCCSGSTLAEHRDKIANHENIGKVRDADIRIELHAWSKRADGKYHLRMEDLS